MKYDNNPDAFLEELWNSVSSAPPEPLFEEQSEAEKQNGLTDRVETLEFRINRALLCLDQCQKELTEMQKWRRGVICVLQAQQKKQERYKTIIKCGTPAVIGLLFVMEIKPLASLGQTIFQALSRLLHVEAGLISGALLVVVCLCLLLRLTQLLLRKFLRRQEKGDDEA